ncbi:tRNA (cytosine(34)-C(5))-methyltransferase [Galdieria sulphuraria]|nr:tRNA (cytosine(34)-C(5))-methyltransferase [Galdieria sulphuraria]
MLDKQGNGASTDNRDNDCAHNTVERGQQRFKTYYEEQELVDEEEWNHFWNTLFVPLPACFWISQSHPSSTRMSALCKQLEAYFSSVEEVDSIKSSIPYPLKWFPNELAWCLNISRQVLKRDEKLSKLHDFIVEQNSSGVINRQEAVSMLPPVLLQVQPGDKVLDMCAAPGSKTAQLLDMLGAKNYSAAERQSLVVANDSNLKRCWMLIHQLKRFSCPYIVITNHEAQKFPVGMRFNRILCDVPCSGDGTLRKSPDLWKRWYADTGMNLHPLQLAILLRGCDLLETGGKLVYSTCSLNPVENEAVVAEVLRRRSTQISLINVDNLLSNLKFRRGLTSWKVKNNAEEFGFFTCYEEVPLHRRKKIPPSLFPKDDLKDLGIDKCIRILPHDQDTGGFFIAMFEKVSRDTQDTWQKLRFDKEKAYMKTRRISRLISDDPFERLSTVNISLLKTIAYFYGLDEELLSNHLMTRTSDAGRVRRIYYLSEQVKSIVENSVGNLDRLTTDDDNEKYPYRVVHGGIRCFEAVDCKYQVECPYRIVFEGAPLIALRMSKRLEYVEDEEVWNFLLHVKDVIKIAEIPFINLRTSLEQTSPGSVIFCFTNESTKDYLTAWLGPSMLSIFVTTEDIRLLQSHISRNYISLTDMLNNDE